MMLYLQGCTYRPCKHFLDRWKQRFSGIDMLPEFASCKRVGKKQLKLIKLSSPVSSAKYLGGEFKGRYCVLGRSNVVFVIQGDTVVTAFHLYGGAE